jgi:hypothetical protein
MMDLKYLCGSFSQLFPDMHINIYNQNFCNKTSIKFCVLCFKFNLFLSQMAHHSSMVNMEYEYLHFYINREICLPYGNFTV